MVIKNRSIRPFVKDDIPQVADLHEKVFGCRERSAPPTLRAYFEEVFLNNPWYDDALPSLVYQEHNRKITGFMGVLPRRMSINGRPVQVAISTQLMVEPHCNGLEALQLLETFFSGPQDLSLDDGADDIGRKLWLPFRGTTALLYSIHWTRPLRPARYIMSILSKRKPLAPLAFIARPFCSGLDAFATRMPQSHFRQSATSFSEEELTEETFLAYLPKLVRRRLLRPEYDEVSIRWLFDMAAQTNGHGNFQKVLVRNQKQEIAGWYIYYLNPGGISEVLQIVAKENSINDVLDRLFYHAWRKGVIALSGRLEPRFMQEFSDKYCLFNRGGSLMLMHSNKPELLQAIYRGDAFLTRLECEWWMRFNVDSFE